MSTPHPTDEQLSAALDGEDPGASAHAETCAECQDKLARLRSVMAAVSVAPPVDQVARERDIAAALKAPPVSRRALPFGPIAAAAAVVLVVALAVGLLLDRGPSSNQVASRDRSALQASKGPESATDGATMAGPVDGGDLGELSDPQALRSVVAPYLGESAAGAGQADSAAASTTTNGPGAPAAVSGGGAQGSTGGAVTCTATVQKEYSASLGGLLYTARVRWNGTPAVVLAYSVSDPSAGKLDHRVFVLSRSNCALLTYFTL
ncbi:MAG TPA: hypothetical protein VGO92_15225 [Acidimicrobiales bacterium]|jgi:negative regulator of sigma E activity|nr:hypothetical protein [Acidimicrobiales bacterium]